MKVYWFKMNSQKPFRIVHLSDLHLTRTDNVKRTEQNIFEPLKGMNAAFREIVSSDPIQNADLTIVTGDITDRGSPKEWSVFWEIVRNANLADKIIVIPGNHDVCCLGARLPSLKKKMYRDADLKKAVNGLRLGNQPTKFPWVRVPDPRVVIFGLNSNNMGNLSVITNAMGELGYYQLKSLANLLYKHREIPVKIIVLHHSPNIPEEATAKKRGQKSFNILQREGHQLSSEERHGLMLLCVAHRVRLILHGHLHMAEDRRISGIRIIGAASSTEPGRNPKKRMAYRFQAYQVQGKGGRVRHDKRWIATNY